MGHGRLKAPTPPLQKPKIKAGNCMQVFVVQQDSSSMAAAWQQHHSSITAASQQRQQQKQQQQHGEVLAYPLMFEVSVPSSCSRGMPVAISITGMLRRKNRPNRRNGPRGLTTGADRRAGGRAGRWRSAVGRKPKPTREDTITLAEQWIGIHRAELFQVQHLPYIAEKRVVYLLPANYCMQISQLPKRTSKYFVT